MDYTVRYKNTKFSNQKVELDGKSFLHCEFENCLILLERGETEISGCSFKNCKLMLKGNAYTVGKIIKLFTGKGPLKVLDMEEPPTLLSSSKAERGATQNHGETEGQKAPNGTTSKLR